MLPAVALNCSADRARLAATADLKFFPPHCRLALAPFRPLAARSSKASEAGGLKLAGPSHPRAAEAARRCLAYFSAPRCQLIGGLAA
jgi:hypothetical protein